MLCHTPTLQIRSGGRGARANIGVGVSLKGTRVGGQLNSMGQCRGGRGSMGEGSMGEGSMGEGNT